MNMLLFIDYIEFCCLILLKGLYLIIMCYIVFVFMKCYLKFKYNILLDKKCVIFNNFYGI